MTKLTAITFSAAIAIILFVLYSINSLLSHDLEIIKTCFEAAASCHRKS